MSVTEVAKRMWLSTNKKLSVPILCFILTSVTIMAIGITMVRNLEKRMEKFDGISEDIANLKTQLYHQRQKREVEGQLGHAEHEVGNVGGAVYVRWGRETCPGEETELVYMGNAGGKQSGNSGSGVNLLCLPNKPSWPAHYSDGIPTNYGPIYGAEYREGDGYFRTENSETFLNHNVPCAVCRSTTRNSAIMLPASNQCTNDWHIEYRGYLMSGSYRDKSTTEFVCVDESPVAEKSGYIAEAGYLLYFVRGYCGSLPCPNYVHGRELSCSVCTK